MRDLHAHASGVVLLDTTICLLQFVSGGGLSCSMYMPPGHLHIV